MTANPFLDPNLRHLLYGNSARLAGRTQALLRAKTSGRPVAPTIADLIKAHRPTRAARAGTIVDIGCGRGTSSRALAERLAPRRLICVDAAPALLNEARRRVGAWPHTQVDFVQADFHRLPLSDGRCAAAVAAFCLYHSPHPEQVIAQIARVLADKAVAVLVTKSRDSYRELDWLLARTGLDPTAEQHGSLYASAHSTNLADLARFHLDVVAVEHEKHRFTFANLDHAAEYLATNPKYHLADGLYGSPQALAAALRARHPDRPVATSSCVTYVVARPLGGGS
ncbi:class I SAM-dependent methyltransferase [Embleya sp. NPDC055664]